ncbi:MAG TPA: hypothetical protein VFN56_04020 [Candidatus Saccharimonadales bacterium]|nr:hypothetical protein [Candidatus Saccharimonadales bacterium]
MPPEPDASNSNPLPSTVSPGTNNETQSEGHPIRNIAIFFGIIMLLSFGAIQFTNHILSPVVSFIVRTFGNGRLTESIAGWLPWALLPLLLAALFFRIEMLKRKSTSMVRSETYVWGTLISLYSAFLLILLATTVPRLGSHNAGIPLPHQAARFVQSSYYVSATLISMLWTLLGWALLLGIDQWLHPSTAGATKQWSWAFIFSFTALLSLITVLLAVLTGISAYIAVFGVPLAYFVSRTGYIVFYRRPTTGQQDKL